VLSKFKLGDIENNKNRGSTADFHAKYTDGILKNTKIIGGASSFINKRQSLMRHAVISKIEHFKKID
jgi:hypothetical protein